jgi:penicillin-binding protein 1A
MAEASTNAGAPRVLVANPADGGYFYWLGKLAGFAALVVLTLMAVAGVTVYGYFARSAPNTPDLDHYAELAPAVSRFYAGDGSLLGEFADEYREVVPYERLPRPLVDAFLAAEDHRFFDHRGIDAKGIARAMWLNLTRGEFAQGGSTITQQVCKQFAGDEKTLARKAREAICALRLEHRYSKEEILTVYLNHIFLGSGAFGVEAAAKRYFSRHVWELDLAQMALIAGLAQAPSRDSPLVSLARAQRRRDAVLDKMVRAGVLGADEASTWKAAPLTVHPYRDPFLERSPYYAEHVRRQVVKKYGVRALMRGGLVVETAVEPWLDGVAYENVDWNARKQDRRQGYRGPEAHLEGAAVDTFVRRAAEHYGDGPLVEGRRVLAVVDKVQPAGAEVRVGARSYRLPLARMSWAARWSKTNDQNDQVIGSAREALRVGDVIWVEKPRRHLRRYADWTLDEKLNARWLPERNEPIADDEVALAQTPRVQAATITFDHHTGYVLAMVGGQDYGRSEFNRATQACRQPGSTYKPIYYSAALDLGYGFDTALNDIPTAEVDPVTGQVWTPENLHGSVETLVTLEYALVFSKNVPSVDIFKKVGAKNVEAWARRLGFTSPIIADRALALGASCTYMDELARAFAIFARNGRWLDLAWIRRIKDRDGKILEDHTVYADPMLSPGERLDRLAATAGDRPRQAIPARAAFLTTKLLRAMVTHGYNGNLRATGVTAAGKTGTSSATMDLWFVAFTSRWTTGVWLGDDRRERQLGRTDAAYMTAVPFWARYMHEATQGQTFAEIPWEVPPGVKPDDRGDNKGAEAAASAPDGSEAGEGDGRRDGDGGGDGQRDGNGDGDGSGDGSGKNGSDAPEVKGLDDGPPAAAKTAPKP